MAAGDILDSFAVDKKFANHWVLSAKKFTLGGKNLPQFRNNDFCLSTTSNALLLSFDAADLCNDLRLIVCGSRDEKSCTQAAATPNLSKLGDLVINFNKLDIVFKPEEYTFFFNSTFYCHFDVPENERSNQKCPPYTQIGLGKMFF